MLSVVYCMLIPTHSKWKGRKKNKDLNVKKKRGGKKVSTYNSFVIATRVNTVK